jgi:hypothetical protein
LRLRLLRSREAVNPPSKRQLLLRTLAKLLTTLLCSSFSPLIFWIREIFHWLITTAAKAVAAIAPISTAVRKHARDTAHVYLLALVDGFGLPNDFDEGATICTKHAPSKGAAILTANAIRSVPACNPTSAPQEVRMPFPPRSATPLRYLVDRL